MRQELIILVTFATPETDEPLTMGEERLNAEQAKDAISAALTLAGFTVISLEEKP